MSSSFTRAPAESPTVPRIAPVEVSWAKAGVPNHKAKIKKQRLTLDIDSHPRLNRILDESRVEKGTCWV